MEAKASPNAINRWYPQTWPKETTTTEEKPHVLKMHRGQHCTEDA
jgi:hypothetical protein